MAEIQLTRKKQKRLMQEVQLTKYLFLCKIKYVFFYQGGKLSGFISSLSKPKPKQSTSSENVIVAPEQVVLFCVLI